MLNETVGYVYFLRINDLIKIGHSENPKQRIRSHKYNFPDLYTLAIVPNSVITESEAHKKFAHLRVRNELFRPEPELLDFIERLPSVPEAEAIVFRQLYEEMVHLYGIMPAGHENWHLQGPRSQVERIYSWALKHYEPDTPRPLYRVLAKVKRKAAA